ncbi:MAG: UvrD-helicase domain-containing protein, partial [Bacteroidaceae bacterium]|nr:UvrD-helicase domain-containing protein [Bacteroidaceae bacterium]
MSNNTPLTVYKASAGSGKTFTLAVEYIAILIASDDKHEFRHILAVTFTNKATSEMKDRILQQLYGIANALSSSDKYLRCVQRKLQANGTTLTDDEVRRRAREAVEAILHDYSHFRVETIDSFFQSVVRNLAHELGLNANLQVELNAKELVGKAVDRMIDMLKEEGDEIARWILDYVNSKMDEGSSWNITQTVKKLAECIYMEEFQNRSKEHREALAKESKVVGFRNKMYAVMNQAVKDVEDDCQQVVATIDNGPLDFKTIYNGTRSWLGFIARLPEMEKDDLSDVIKRGIDDPSLLLKKDDKDDPAMHAAAEEVTNLVQDLFLRYKERQKRYNTATLALKFINELRLLGCIEEYCNIIAAENNQFVLNKTAVLLSRLVQGN